MTPADSGREPAVADSGRRPVLILDGETRTALAVVRSIGRHHPVIVGTSERFAPASASRFCACTVRLPSPRESSAGVIPGESFMQELLAVIAEHTPEMVLPLTDISWDIMLRNRDRLPRTLVLPGAEPEVFAAASNKSELLRRAQQLGVHTPRTLRIEAGRANELSETIAAFPYPAVLKPEWSEQRSEGSYRKAGVYYVADPADVQAQLSRGEHAGLSFLLQQRIRGEGVGVFALCLDGDAAALFCHRRVLEKPPSGGRSVLSQSIPENEAPVREALALLRDLRWTGVAMVEFKRTASGENYLMEINPRLWGSLQLAIDSGRDYPTLLHTIFRSAEQREKRFLAVKSSLAPYQSGRRLRWDLGCLDHALIRLKNEGRKGVSDLILRNSLQLFAKPFQTGHETFRLTDPLPFVYELLSYVLNVLR